MPQLLIIINSCGKFIFCFKKEDSSKRRSLSGNYDETNLLNINILGFEQKRLCLNGRFVFEESDVNYESPSR